MSGSSDVGESDTQYVVFVPRPFFLICMSEAIVPCSVLLMLGSASGRDADYVVFVPALSVLLIVGSDSRWGRDEVVIDLRVFF